MSDTPFTYADLTLLDKALSEQVDPENQKQTLAAFTDWLQTEAPVKVGVDQQTGAMLYEYARGSHGAGAAHIAVGAIQLIQTQADEKPKSAGILARYALHRIRQITGNAPTYATPRLSDSDRDEAEALFEAALGDRSFKNEELLSEVQEFVSTHTSDPFLFGRLAHDLSLLTEVMVNGDSEARRIARAALTYFAVVADAIPDDLGPAGYLDDAFVVRRAIDQIMPARGALAGFLDDLVSKWPFLVELRFDEESTAPPSEFLLANAALALEMHQEETPGGIAVVVPETGPLSMVMAFVRAVANVRERLEEGALPDIEHGERLLHRDTGAEVTFAGYRRFEGSTHIPCASDEATHVAIQSPGRGKNASPVIRLRGVDSIHCFRRTARSTKTLRGGDLTQDAAAFEIGPLERMFHASCPIVLPRRVPRVLLVGADAPAKRLAEDLKIFGRSMYEIIPVARMKITPEGQCVEEPWTAKAAGGDAIIATVQSTSEACEIVENGEFPIDAVIAEAKPGSTDILNLGRIQAEGVQTIALLSQTDYESAQFLSEAGFSFWSWSNAWLKQLHWPKPRASRGHPIWDYETRLRRGVVSEVTHVEVDNESLTLAHRALGGLIAELADLDEEAYAEFKGAAFRSLVTLCKQIAPASDDDRVALRGYVQDVLDVGARNLTWWPVAAHEHFRGLCEHLEEALETVVEELPKYEALRWLCGDQPDALVVGTDRQAMSLADDLDNRVVPLGALGQGTARDAVIIPAWLGRGRMERLLNPPCGKQITMVLYPIEVPWFHAAVRRRQNADSRMDQFVSRRSAVRSVPTTDGTTPSDPTGPSVPDDAKDLHEEILKARTQAVLGALDQRDGDPVEAKVVHFVGGSWAAMTPTHVVYVVSRDHDSRDGSKSSARIEEQTANGLKPGDMLLLRRGTPRDVIWDAVDELVPPSMRDDAATWRRALKRKFEAGWSVDRLVTTLAQSGCERTRATVERWLQDDRIIGPAHPKRDLDAIVAVTRDAELDENRTECISAIHELRRKHLQVATELAETVMNRAHEWFDAGATASELVELESQLVLAIVEGVDQERQIVARGAANRLVEPT